MDPNLGAADPYGPIQGAWHWVHSHCYLFLSLGCWNATHQKLERDVTSALGGHLLVRQHSNQPKVGVCGRRDIGECAQTGRNMWGGRCTIIWGGKLSNKKIKIKIYALALNSRRSIFEMQQPAKNKRAQWRRERWGDLTGGEHGGSVISSFWGQLSSEGIKTKIKLMSSLIIFFRPIYYIQ